MRTLLRVAATSLAFAAVLSTGLFAAGGGQTTPLTPSRDDGAWLYKVYCSACHGESARGDGPLADSLRRRPPNLTEIIKREGGSFPNEKVFRIIDGRTRVPGHGGPDMPAWGDAFKRSQEGGDEANVARSIEAIVRYLESIQVRMTP